LDLVAKLRAQPGGELLLATARRYPAEVFLVGGAVRDLLLERAPRELDVVVIGDAATFARSLGSVPVEHPRFGTAVVEVDGARIDVAGARRERYPQPGALPEVQAPATLAEDLARRDFTVNAIAVALGGESPGTMSWAPQALKDMDGRRLRVLHDASFEDDPTRLLRLARYAARLDFRIEPHTAELAARAVAGGALQTVSGARLGAELRLALAEPGVVGALATMDDLGLLVALHPRLRFDRELLGRALGLLPEDGRPDRGALAALVLPLALRADGDRGAEIAGLLDRLEFAAVDRDRVRAAAIAVPRLMGELPAASAKPSRIRAAVADVPPEGIALAGAVHEPAAEPARRWLTELCRVRLAITGADLLASGVAEGPEVGRRLERVLELRLDGELADGREAELRAALDV
jgi:tRNA nucleotidyltransferase (CCA-adding enzyme)